VIYDAVLVARRGLGADELRLASEAFRDAVRWASFAEATYSDTPELEAIVAQSPDGLTGQTRTDFIANRAAARTEIKRRRVLLLLEEPDPPAEVTGG